MSDEWTPKTDRPCEVLDGNTGEWEIGFFQCIDENKRLLHVYVPRAGKVFTFIHEFVRGLYLPEPEI